MQEYIVAQHFPDPLCACMFNTFTSTTCIHASFKRQDWMNTLTEVDLTPGGQPLSQNCWFDHSFILSTHRSVPCRWTSDCCCPRQQMCLWTFITCSQSWMLDIGNFWTFFTCGSRSNYAGINFTGARSKISSSCVLFFFSGLMVPTGELAPTAVYLHHPTNNNNSYWYNRSGWKHSLNHLLTFKPNVDKDLTLLIDKLTIMQADSPVLALLIVIWAQCSLMCFVTVN